MKLKQPAVGLQCENINQIRYYGKGFQKSAEHFFHFVYFSINVKFQEMIKDLT